MCRWLAYYGNPIRPEALLHDTKYSLVEQSRRDRLAGAIPTPTASASGGTAPTSPGLYRSIAPAWATATCASWPGRSSRGSSWRTSALPRAPGRADQLPSVPPRPMALRPQRVHRRLPPSSPRPAARGGPELVHRNRGDHRLRADVPPRAHLRAREEPMPALERMAGFVEATGRRHGVDEPLQMTVGLSDGERLYAARYASGPVVNSLFVTADAERRPRALSRGRALPEFCRRGAGGRVRAARRPARRLARGPGRLGARRPTRPGRAVRLHAASAGLSRAVRPWSTGRRSRAG